MPLAEDPSAAAQPPRKRSRRLWLLAPYALVVLLLLGWSVGWFVVKGRIEQGLDDQARALRGAGWTVALTDRRVSGFPFRLHVKFGEAQLAAPSGWAVAIPGLEGEAYLHAPDHWVLIAPHGLTFVRPKGGPVAVSGQTLRVSLAGLSRPIWRVVLEGSKVAFSPSPDAQPFALASAELMQLYVKPSSVAGEALWLVRVEGGAAAPNTLLGALAHGKQVSAKGEGRWQDPRGAVVSANRRLLLDFGEVSAGATSARLPAPAILTVGGDGRLNGALPIDVSGAPQSLSWLASPLKDVPSEGGTRPVLETLPKVGDMRLFLVFREGATTLGPVRVGSAPKLF